MKFYTVYQTTNLVNGKIYIGKHTTTNPDDGYYGSGRALNRAIAKYSKESFVKEILFLGFTEEDAYWFEEILVDAEFIKRADTYNEIPGGKGSVAGELNQNYGRVISDEERLHRSKVRTGMKIGPYSDEARHRMSVGQTGKKYSQATRDKMSKARSGEGNHMFGKTTSAEVKAKQSKAKIKYVYKILTPDGDTVTTNNLEQFCKDHSLNSGNMYGPAKKSKGYSVISRESNSLEHVVD